jgi:hypothetical protein
MQPRTRTLLTAGIIFAGFSLVGNSANAQATAVLCKDGSTSATAGRGACSGHGGVNRAASKAAAKTVKKQAKAASQAANRTQGAEVTVTCADGSTTHTTGRGACARHGGIKAASATSKATGAPIAVPNTATPRDRGAMSPTMNPPVANSRARQRTSTNSAVAGSGAREDNNPAGAIAQCKDGMYSHSQHRTGTCSRHGGVAKWM